MTPQQIKDNAPKGATHYYKQSNNVVIYFIVRPDGSQKKVTPSYGHETWVDCNYNTSKLKPL